MTSGPTLQCSEGAPGLCRAHFFLILWQVACSADLVTSFDPRDDGTSALGDRLLVRGCNAFAIKPSDSKRFSFPVTMKN